MDREGLPAVATMPMSTIVYLLSHSFIERYRRRQRGSRESARSMLSEWWHLYSRESASSRLKQWVVAPMPDCWPVQVISCAGSRQSLNYWIRWSSIWGRTPLPEVCAIWTVGWQRHSVSRAAAPKQQESHNNRVHVCHSADLQRLSPSCFGKVF